MKVYSNRRLLRLLNYNRAGDFCVSSERSPLDCNAVDLITLEYNVNICNYLLAPLLRKLSFSVPNISSWLTPSSLVKEMSLKTVFITGCSYSSTGSSMAHCFHYQNSRSSQPPVSIKIGFVFVAYHPVPHPHLVAYTYLMYIKGFLEPA